VAATLEPLPSTPGAAEGAQLWLVRAGSIAEVSELVVTDDWHGSVDGRGGFGLLLAWEGEAPGFDQVAALARVLIGQGLYYFGAWGRGDARVEYAVDVTDVTMQIDASSGTDAAIVMTTAFGPVPLDDALFELSELAPRDEGKPDGPARVVVVIGERAGEALARTVVGRRGGGPASPRRDTTGS
jgi:hypothetical protein